MARSTNALTAKGVEAIKGDSKIRKYFDGGGLFLQVTPKGSKSWRLKYRINGKEKSMSLGSYPEISLANARDLRFDLRSKIAKGIDPLIERQEIKEKLIQEETKRADTLFWVSLHYFIWKRKSGEMAENTLNRLIRRFGVEFLDKLGSTPIGDVTEADLRALLLGMHTRGAEESSRRFHTQLLKFYEWLRELEYVSRGVPTAIEMISKKHLLPLDRTKKANYPIITDLEELGALLRDLDHAPCEYPTRQALKIMPHLAIRPGNLRLMEWKEIDFDQKVWIIPGSKMKRGVTHVIPLTDYVISIIKETGEHYSAGRDLVFPSFRTMKALSEATLNGGIKRILNDAGERKYKVVTHSFRGIFSTLVRTYDKDHKFPNHVIESALAHGLGTEVEQAYNRADYLDQRRELMQWWTDYLLELKNKP